MKLIQICLILGSLPLLAGCVTPHADYGEPMTDQRVQVDVADVLANPDQYVGETLAIEGEVTEVCAKKGCWLRFGPEGGDQDIFVKFTCPISGHLIPAEAVGHRVTIEGELLAETISEEEARHYAEDAGQSPEQIAKIVGEQRRFRVNAPSARVWGMKAGSAQQPTSRPAS